MCSTFLFRVGKVLSRAYLFCYAENELSELSKILEIELKKMEKRELQNTWDDLLKIVDQLICKDLLQKEFSNKDRYKGETLSYVLNDPSLPNREIIEVEIYRDKEYVVFCNYHLNPGGKKDFSLQNLTRFLEIGGMKMLRNRIRIVDV